MNYMPDHWVVIKIRNIYKVLGSWSGGYLDSDSWRLNSGIVNTTYEKPYYKFYGYSGSVYQCHENMYGTSIIMESVLNNINKNSKIDIEILPKDFEFLSIKGEDS